MEGGGNGFGAETANPSLVSQGAPGIVRVGCGLAWVRLQLVQNMVLVGARRPRARVWICGAGGHHPQESPKEGGPLGLRISSLSLTLWVRAGAEVVHPTRHLREQVMLVTWAMRGTLRKHREHRSKNMVEVRKLGIRVPVLKRREGRNNAWAEGVLRGRPCGIGRCVGIGLVGPG